MATYDVIAVGFHEGILHSPDHATRNVIITDKPFEKAPSWVKQRDAKSLSPAQKAAATKARNKAEADNATQIMKDKAEIVDATFMATSSKVETL